MKSKKQTSDTQVLKPVKQYRTPIYPEREVFLDNPSLLSEYVPSSWKILKIPAAALLFFALNNCSDPEHGMTRFNDTLIVEQKNKKQPNEYLTKDQSIIAPLFIHGEGAGSTGCVAIAPPSFLSEADTIEMIRTKLAKEGIIFDKQNYIVEGIYSLDDSELISQMFDDQYISPKSNRHPFYYDLYSTRYNFGIKFISMRMEYELGEIRSELQDKIEARILADIHPGKKTDPYTINGILSTHYDLIEIAQRTREFLRKYSKVNAAFFYDPLERPGRKQRRSGLLEIDIDIDEIQKSASQLLEEQVNDFIVWFKSDFVTSKKGDL